MTEQEKQYIINSVLAQIRSDSQGVDTLPLAESLSGVSSLPCLKGEDLVSVPLSLFEESVASTAASAAAGAIADETTARTTADSNLQAQITVNAENTDTRFTQQTEEITRVEGKVDANTALITAETTAREEADASEAEIRSTRDGRLRGWIEHQQKKLDFVIDLLTPSGMTVDYPKSITITNPERQQISATLDGYNMTWIDFKYDEDFKQVVSALRFGLKPNVIFQSDNRAVFVMTDGTIVPLAVGRSLVNIVPTRNTDLAQTVTIDVHEPYLSKVSASSLKLTGSGALRFL